MNTRTDGRLEALLRRLLPRAAREWIRARRLTAWPPVGAVRLGTLRRVTPLSECFGFDRGLPIDRYYIERFFESEAGPQGRGDIQGRVLEIKEDLYASRFAAGSLERVDVLDVDAGNENATIVADLTRPEGVPPEAFDCAICTQTLQLIYDPRSAIRTLHGGLKPGGVLLATVPGISPGCAGEGAEDYWRFTAASALRLFEDVFGEGAVGVHTYGNVLSALGFLHGLAAEELDLSELGPRDPRYEVIVAVRAVRVGDSPGVPRRAS